jgi:hypothetical protein
MFYNNNGDPLLHTYPAQSLFANSNTPSNNSNSSIMEAYAQLYKHQMEMQQQNQKMFPKDWITELDNAMKELEPSATSILNEDIEFTTLNAQLQALIQSEIMGLVKVNINTNQNAVENIKRQMTIIQNATNKVKSEEKQNMSDLNDYIKNYSHLTFDEYKNLKNGSRGNVVTSSQVTETKKTKK